MLVWATEFLVDGANRSGDVIGVAKGALASSRHTPWQTDSFGQDPVNDLMEHRLQDHVVRVGCVGTSDGHWAGVQHQWIENGEREWTTDVVCHETLGDLLISVRLDCNLLVPGAAPPRAKKPYVIGRLIDDLGGGKDSKFLVGNTPHRLSEADVEDAAAVVRGTSGTRLPLVYVSVRRSRQPFVDVDDLARRLAGMAHVIVEPSRHFSFALARNTRHTNAYDGAVGIYWPSGMARQSRFLPSSFSTPREMEDEIVERVRIALTYIRPDSKCTFAYLRELLSRARIEQLRAEGSRNVDEFSSAFDREMRAKDERLQALERELARVRAELRRYDNVPDNKPGILVRGMEREFYPGEISDALIHLLRRGRDSLLADGRRQHLIDDILSANQPTKTEEEVEAEVKEALARSGDLGPAEQRTLEDLGFSIELAGKHIKAVYQGDERYGFTISKTSSDHRAGKNLSGEILRKLFK